MSIARIIEGRNHDVISCGSQDSVLQTAQLLAEKRIGALPVIDDGEVVGIFSERDLLRSVAKEGAAGLARNVADVMAAPPITIAPDIDAQDALSLMTKRRIRHLPVVLDGKLLDFVSIGDLVKYRIDLAEAEAEQMREYISTA